MHQMSERRVKILTEKKGLLAKEIAQINLVQSKELKRLKQELSDTISQLTIQKREYEDKMLQFEKVSQFNEEHQSMHWEVKIEALESEIRKAERARRQIQFKIDNFYRSISVKLAVLSDPHSHIAPQTEEYFRTKRD
jgi:hypothetical protein